MGRRLWDGNAVQPPSDFINLLFNGQREGPETKTTKAGLDATLHSRVVEHDSTDLVDLSDQQALVKLAASKLRLRSSVKQLIELMEGRCLCVNSNGELMNCPSDAKSGDVVAVLADIDSPFIIRPVSVRSGIRGREKRYCLIGDGYVEGIMGGQLEANRARGEPCEFLLV
ncbi:uncharacterized protein K460DRAFT_364433 [Cucurbitaria berberidis CBS 394.84]|uniref:Uncharacterized protein n=1 Tax=Cucurbitaria berberidis CBS 394.84 TaxID=1168544 RepID=A0A9P4GNV4_9PLEO|nr:uncharacterized protein K460DRAFT_364433 [Cucurbitaria berberidis CBS 394.84]KAF1848441.1 hypothetical protein K460DRAFT_364433 [Cucurbitaria berberidis CBS 394.84]